MQEWWRKFGIERKAWDHGIGTIGLVLWLLAPMPYCNVARVSGPSPWIDLRKTGHKATTDRQTEYDSISKSRSPMTPYE